MILMPPTVEPAAPPMTIPMEIRSFPPVFQLPMPDDWKPVHERALNHWNTESRTASVWAAERPTVCNPA